MKNFIFLLKKIVLLTLKFANNFFMRTFPFFLTGLAILCCFSLSLQAQKQPSKTSSEIESVSENDLEDIFRINLKKRIPAPESIDWFFNSNENLYFVNCLAKGQEHTVYFTERGEWLKTQTQINKKELHPSIASYISEQYKGSRIVEAYKEIDSTRMLYTVVELYEKPNIKEGLVTTIYFNKSNKAIKTVQPGGKQDNNSVPTLTQENIPAKVVQTLNRKAPRPTDVEWRFDGNLYHAKGFSKEILHELWINDTGGLVKMKVQISQGGLNQKILQYLMAEHNGYQFVAAYKVSNMGKSDQYQVEIIERKYAKNRLVTTIIFDRNFKMISVEQQDEPENTAQTAKRAEFEKTLDKADSKIEKATKIKPEELPPAIQTYVKSNFSNLNYKKVVFIEEHEEFGPCYHISMSSFSDNVELFFDIKGNVLYEYVIKGGTRVE